MGNIVSPLDTPPCDPACTTAGVATVINASHTAACGTLSATAGGMLSATANGTHPAATGVSLNAPDYCAAGFKPIGLADRERLTALFRSVNPEISDLTFSNLWMWRHMISLRCAWVGGFACLLALPRAYPPYAYAPIGDAGGDPAGFSRAVEFLCGFFRDNGWSPRFRCVPTGLVQPLTNLFSSCECEEDRDFFDYVYLAEDLIGLRGKKFDGKRNHINKFKKMYDFSYERLTSDHIDDCLRIMYDRCVANDCGCLRGDDYACDRKPSAELLSRFSELGCSGAVVKVNGRPEAFTVGEALNADTAVIYIEKANAGIQGLYTYINQQFCEREWVGMTYINREEDEGVPGLRKAKLSYHPVRLVEKFTVTTA